MKASVLLCALAIAGYGVCFKMIEKEVINYYESDNMKSFEKQWRQMKLPIENAIRQSLVAMYGRGEMNVFVKSKPVKMTLTKGFLVSDNIVQVLIVNPKMRELPIIINPEVHLSLDGNVLRVEGGLSKIFIDAGYLLFRNYSNMKYTNLDTEKTSPFSFNQVQDIGSVAITAEACNFLGSGVATLLGSSVNLGYNSFRVQDCKFHIEIFTEGFGTPPVIAPYFDKNQGAQLENLMTKPIADEMNTKIQSALLSYVNTSAIFGLKKLPTYIYEQRKIFRRTAMYLEKTVRNANAAMMEKNKGLIRFKDQSINWNDKAVPDGKTTITIKNLVISGLDTAYSINRGGPYKLKNMTSIAEDFFFHTLNVQGKFAYENGTRTVEYDFGGRILDVHILVKLEISVLKSKDESVDQEKQIKQFCTATSRGFELAVIDIGTIIRERIKVQSFIAGYLYNIVPIKLLEVLSEIFPKAVKLNVSRLLKYATEMNSIDKADDKDDDDDEDDKDTDDDKGLSLSSSVSLDKDDDKSKDEEYYKFKYEEEKNKVVRIDKMVKKTARYI